MQAVLDTICPGEGDLIYKSVLEESGSNEECVNIDLLAEVYKNAETWQTQNKYCQLSQNRRHLKLLSSCCQS